jgi:hypothetical protein
VAVVDRTVSWRRFAAVAAIVAVGLLVRIAAAAVAAAHPDWFNAQLVDQELYVSRGAMLVDTGRWAWTFRAVGFVDGNVTGFIKAPLYQVLLSLFTYAPDYPALVPLGHAVLGALTVAAIYLLALRVHSPRAGLIAVGFYAVWFTSIAAIPEYWQEHLYNLLLTLGAAWLVRAAGDEGRARDEVRGGLALGLAALTRSMPLLFVPLSAVWLRRRRWLAVSVFAAVVVPYIVWLSIAKGTFVPIENISGAFLRFNDPPHAPIAAARDIRDTSGIPQLLARQFAADPVWYTRAIAARVRDTLTVSSHDWLETVIVLPDERTASIVKTIAVAGDVPVAVVLILAPFGVVLARNRRGAGILVTWIAVAVLGTAFIGHSGTRYRWSIDPILIALAAAALDSMLPGRARAPGAISPRLRICAGLASVGMLLAVLTAVPRLARAHADYGVLPWADIYSPSTALVRDGGRAGFVVQPIEGAYALDVRCPPGSPIREVAVTVDGQLRGTVPAEACRGGAHLLIKVEARTRAYTQIEARPAGPMRLTVTYE